MAFTTKTPPVDLIAKALEDAVRAKTKIIIDEEIDKCTAEIQRRLCAEADSIALKILAMYDVERMGEKVVITVKKLENRNDD